MLKMYHKQDHAGSTPDYWEDTWAASEYERSVAFCAIDPLRPLFEKYLRPDSLMLEGGCGIGNYVTYYSQLGYKVVGLDFAQRALTTLRSRQPDTLLCAGDVSNLPFADESFDLYYSGGVVEHFESGSTPSLIEARRVLKQDGVLLISVPYYSPLRRLLTPLKTSEWRRVPMPAVETNNSPGDLKFFQYAYQTREFETMLADAGLKTIEKQGYAVIWGLYELPFVKTNGGETPGGGGASITDDRTSSVPAQPSLLKRLVVSEDSSVPVLGAGVKIMRWAAANMMMYVCVPD
jgi:SAM-dependent methyltransferase